MIKDLKLSFRTLFSCDRNCLPLCICYASRRPQALKKQQEKFSTSDGIFVIKSSWYIFHLLTWWNISSWLMLVTFSFCDCNLLIRLHKSLHSLDVRETLLILGTSAVGNLSWLMSVTFSRVWAPSYLSLHCLLFPILTWGNLAVWCYWSLPPELINFLGDLFSVMEHICSFLLACLVSSQL